MIVVLLRKEILTFGELTDATIVALNPNSFNCLYNENSTEIFPTFCKFNKFIKHILNFIFFEIYSIFSKGIFFKRIFFRNCI